MTAFNKPNVSVIYRGIVLDSRYVVPFEFDVMRRMVDVVNANGWSRALVEVFCDSKASNAWGLKVKFAEAVQPVFDAVSAHLFATEGGYNWLAVALPDGSGEVNDGGCWDLAE